MDTQPQISPDPIEFNAYADLYIQKAKDIRHAYEDKGKMDDLPEIPHFIALGNRLVEMTRHGTTGDLTRARAFFCTIVYHPYDYPDDKVWAATGLAIINTLKTTLPYDTDLKHDDIVMQLYWAYAYKQDDPEKALSIYDEVLPLIIELDDMYLQTMVYMGRGNLYYLTNKQKSLQDYQQALSLSRKTKRLYIEAVCLQSLGAIWLDLKHSQKAINFYEKAYAIYEQLGYLLQQARIQYELGQIWNKLNHQDIGLDYYRNAIALYEQANNKEGVALATTMLGLMLAHTDVPQARIHLEQAQSLYHEMDYQGFDHYILVSLATVWANLGDYQKAFEISEQAIAQSRTKSNKKSEYYALYNLGNLHTKLGNTQQALDQYQQALLLGRDLDDKYHQVNCLMAIGDSLKKLGHNQQALPHYEGAVLLATELKSQVASEYCYNQMSDIYKALGDEERAQAYARKARSAKGKSPFDLFGLPEMFIERLHAWLTKRQER